MNENLEVMKILLEDYIDSATEEMIDVRVIPGNLGVSKAFRATLSRQMTLDDYMEKSERSIPSFLVYEVFVNPRFFMKWTPRKMAMEIRQDFIKQMQQEG